MVGEYGDRVAIGLDVRGRTLSARGWTRDGGDLFEVLARLNKAGCARYVVTDIIKDGMMRGPEPGPAARGLRPHRRPGDRLRRSVHAGRPARAGHAGAARRGGRDRRQGALRRRVHGGRGAGGAEAGHDASSGSGSGGPWEEIFGYSRVVRGRSVRVHRRLYVHGGRPVVHVGDCRRADPAGVRDRADALAKAGAAIGDVVRTRMYVSAAADGDAVGRVHGEIFGAVRPAADHGDVVAGLIDPDHLVEVEVEA